MKFYLTEWQHVSGKRGVYKTKKLTDFHFSYHDDKKFTLVRTVEVDTDCVTFPLVPGLIIKYTKRNPTN